jgi:AcrR family transcriptional regulator
MKKTSKGTLARERIFKAGSVLFAQKGYHAVGVREIADTAGVKLPMISYYFGGKEELLKAIISDGFAKFYDSIKQEMALAHGIEQMALAEARGTIRFFREYTEIALVAFAAFPIDMAEIHKLRTSLIRRELSSGPRLLEKLKLDVDDPAIAHVFSEFMYAIVRNHFQYRYSLNFYPTAEKIFTQQKGKANRKNAEEIFDDAFYERYAEIVAKSFILSAKEMKNG